MRKNMKKVYSNSAVAVTCISIGIVSNSI